MSSAGRSGMSDTDHTNFPGGQGNPTGTPPDMSSAPGASGPFMPGEMAPDDQIEMVEIVEVEDGTEGLGAGGFQWWYVPAIGMPAIVGAGAAIWYLTKGAEPYTNAWELVTRPVRTLTGQPTVTAKTKRAARRTGKTSDTLRDRMAGALAGFDASDLAEKASDLWDDARDSMVDLWDQITDRDTLNQARDTAGNARDAAQRQLGKLVGAVAAAGTALAIQQRVNSLANATREKAQAARDTAQGTTRRMRGGNAPSPRRVALGLGLTGGTWLARNRARAKARALKANARQQHAKQGTSVAAKATTKAVKVKSQRAAKRARRNVTAPFRRMSTFAFAALVTAMVIYVRSWYMRRGSTDRLSDTADTGGVRETAGGRMEPDTWPQFSDRPADAAAPTAANAPTEPS